MVLWDVNLLLYAAKPELPDHAQSRGLLQALLDEEEPFGLSELILAAVVRIATNPKVFQPPVSPASAFDFCRSLREHPQAVTVSPGPRHWQIFQDLVLSAGIRGSDTTDAYLAALAIEHGCEWWTTDTDFARFPGLRWHNPLAR